MAATPPRQFEREFFAPLPVGFVFPYVEHFSFYDHRGSFREQWPYSSITVADRATDVEPSEGKYHFVMDVHEFLAVYPYPIGTQISSVTCTWVTYAQNHKWMQFVRDGSILRTAEEFLFMLYIGSRAAGETSPGALKSIIGQPTYSVSTFDHGDPADVEPVREKNFDIYTRGLPAVEPSHPVPVELQRPRASHPDPVVQMMLRSAFPASFARAHVRAWDLEPHPIGVDPRPACVVAPGYQQHRELMICRYWIFSAQWASIVDAIELARVDRPRLLIAVPMGHTGTKVAALMPKGGGCYATVLQEGVPLLQQVQAFKSFLPCDVEPQQMGQTRDARADVVFSMPCSFKVTEVLSNADAWAYIHATQRAAWCAPDALTGAQSILASIAFDRCRSSIQAVSFLAGTIGVYEGPRPVYANRAAERFRSAHDSDHAAQEWADFLELERQRKQLFVDAFERANAGSGLLAPFLENIITAFDLVEDLPRPRRACPPSMPTSFSSCPTRSLPPLSAPTTSPECHLRQCRTAFLIRLLGATSAGGGGGGLSQRP